MELEDKVIIVTGASSGIGLEIVKVLAAGGAKIAMAARKMEKLEKAATDLASTGATVIVVPTDVTRAADCRALVRATVDAFGQIDVLVNNAGYAPPASLLETTEEVWDVTLNVCLKGVYLMTQTAVPTMLEQSQGGTIINISSVAGKNGYENLSAYCAAKWGVHGFTEALRAEFEGENLRFHLICPAAVATPWWDTRNDPQADKVMKRMIQPDEVAEAVRWVLTQPNRLRIDEIVIRTHRSPWD